MDLQPQVSFIPKKPLNSAAGSPASLSILWLLAVFIFLVSIVAALAAFLYGEYLQSWIGVASSSLAKSESAYDPAAIADLVRLDSRIQEAKSLLSTHLAPSTIFTFLEGNTLSTVRFNQFSYNTNPDGTVSLKLTGNALDFASVALQSDQFDATSSAHMLSNVIFSNITIDPTSGIVSFDVTANVDPSTVLYESALPTLPATSGSVAPASQNPPLAAPAESSTTPAAHAGATAKSSQ